MNNRKKLLISSGIIFLLLVLIGVAFLFWHRSQESSIQYENDKNFESITASEEESLQVVESTTNLEEDLTEEKQADLVVEEKKEAAKPPQEKSSDTSPKDFTLKTQLVGFGYESASDRDINAIVLHSSHGVNGDPYNVEDVIALWKSYGVAPHYMIARDGTVYQLVADKNIAYHAGDSKMPDGRNGVNNFSIGVEILNTKTDEYTSAQYQATKDLIVHLKKRYGKMTVVGHDTIAPGRKSDPWNFNWSKL